MRKFIIDRQTWHRGQGHMGSYLLIPTTRKMCCLGHISLQCGFSEKDILQKAAPHCVLQNCEKYPEALRPIGNTDSDLVGEMMLLNDREYEDRDYEEFPLEHDFSAPQLLSDEEREAKLIELCAPHGIALEFIN